MGKSLLDIKGFRAFRIEARGRGARRRPVALFDINVISIAPDRDPVSPRLGPQNTGTALESLASHGVCSYSLTVK